MIRNGLYFTNFLRYRKILQSIVALNGIFNKKICYIISRKFLKETRLKEIKD